ncbi:uncharacterized protein LOC120108971 [Phoenix dactylifera]|uniref:Uncharacterized protein LOC120108971 n=1 Tax=Phoenix dactylifera TaxID=42345 RepID=A0A8B8ZWF7_PHODC|nr:uncharacterized protein LOC120108971 [Phoenix dactylifera]
MEIEGRDYFWPPPPRRDPEAWRNPRKYCRFHRDHGHDIEDCFQLRDEIEALIHRGVLDRFIRNRREEKRPAENTAQPENPNANRPIASTINTIRSGTSVGGVAEEGTTPKRLRASETISFSDEDLEGVETPHDDAVVISMVVNKFYVKRVLVDNESSANVLYFDAYSRMGMTEKQLRRMNAPLVRFTGDSVPVEGEIDLLVTVGLAPRERTMRMDFLVVRFPRPITPSSDDQGSMLFELWSQPATYLCGSPPAKESAKSVETKR